MQCILDENLARRAEHYFSEMKRVAKGELIISFMLLTYFHAQEYQNYNIFFCITHCIS
jgi:hypothetical protein